MRTRDGIEGVQFAVWAPNAQRVSVVGDFNGWNSLRHPMLSRPAHGVWELFLPGLQAGDLYKFEILSAINGGIELKSDPYGRAFEMRPQTSSVVAAPSQHVWDDADWIAARAGTDWKRQPISIYEVHLGSWQRAPDGGFLGFRELAERLVPHICALGFTHIELLPISEHPFDGSWGYQPLGHYAPTSRLGNAEDLQVFIDACHRQGLGVLLDWVPAHFPKDAHGLAKFDGTALYEHEDPRRGEHPDWGTLIYNYGRYEVQNFLLSNAVYWLEEFHIDGLRVDAVASMLYLDYSRSTGNWLPNEYGGRENLEAIAFLKTLNGTVHDAVPGALMIAEESTAWPKVSHPLHEGGLGFDLKWNLGWMHDTLKYFTTDPIYRSHHHESLTFGLMYAFSESFLLPFSHDEVVHGKGSMWRKMHGDPWQKMAGLRLLFCYQFTQPGKKLLFMGCELAQENEWDHDASLSWELGGQPERQGLRDLLRDINQLYRSLACLHAGDCVASGFEWIDCADQQHSTLAYLRRAGEQYVVVILNFTPVPRLGVTFGVPETGPFREILNSDSELYGGSNVGNGGTVEAKAHKWRDWPARVLLDLPPLGAVILRHARFD